MRLLVLLLLPPPGWAGGDACTLCDTLCGFYTCSSIFQNTGELAVCICASCSTSERCNPIASDFPITYAPTSAPSTAWPTGKPSTAPSTTPTGVPSISPTHTPSISPSIAPSNAPTDTYQPSVAPTRAPSAPTGAPSTAPSAVPSSTPTTAAPTAAPSVQPTSAPTTAIPSVAPTADPTHAPTVAPSYAPTTAPSLPTADPTSLEQVPWTDGAIVHGLLQRDVLLMSEFEPRSVGRLLPILFPHCTLLLVVCASIVTIARCMDRVGPAVNWCCCAAVLRFGIRRGGRAFSGSDRYSALTRIATEATVPVTSWLVADVLAVTLVILHAAHSLFLAIVGVVQIADSNIPGFTGGVKACDVSGLERVTHTLMEHFILVLISVSSAYATLHPRGLMPSLLFITIVLLIMAFLLIMGSTLPFFRVGSYVFRRSAMGCVPNEELRNGGQPIAWTLIALGVAACCVVAISWAVVLLRLCVFPCSARRVLLKRNNASQHSQSALKWVPRSKLIWIAQLIALVFPLLFVAKVSAPLLIVIESAGRDLDDLERRLARARKDGVLSQRIPAGYDTDYEQPYHFLDVLDGMLSICVITVCVAWRKLYANPFVTHPYALLFMLSPRLNQKLPLSERERVAAAVAELYRMSPLAYAELAAAAELDPKQLINARKVARAALTELRERERLNAHLARADSVGDSDVLRFALKNMQWEEEDDVRNALRSAVEHEIEEERKVLRGAAKDEHRAIESGATKYAKEVLKLQKLVVAKDAAVRELESTLAPRELAKLAFFAPAFDSEEDDGMLQSSSDGSDSGSGETSDSEMEMTTSDAAIAVTRRSVGEGDTARLERMLQRLE